MSKKVKATSTVTSAHDKLFKTSMADIRVARNFFEQYLPPNILAYIDLEDLELQPNTYITQELKATESDVLYKTTIADNTAYLYILSEHQSTVDPLMAFRLWQYQIGIWHDHLKADTKAKKDKRLPLIVPLVFYVGREPWTASLELKDLIEAPADLIEQILYKSATLIDVGQMNDTLLVEQSWAGALAYFLKHARDRDVYLHIQAIMKAGTLQYIESIGGASYITALIYYLMANGDTKQFAALIELFREHLSPKLGVEVMTIAERLKDEGMHMGESAMLERLLAKKFHQVPDFYMEKIKTASSEVLLTWSEHLLDARNLDEVFREH